MHYDLYGVGVLDCDECDHPNTCETVYMLSITMLNSGIAIADRPRLEGGQDGQKGWYTWHAPKPAPSQRPLRSSTLRLLRLVNCPPEALYVQRLTHV